MQMESGGKEEARPQRRWTREEYERLVELGILRPDERLELLDGEILVMSPQGTSHASCSVLAQQALEPLFAGAFHRQHSPIALDDHSEPEPDLAVVRGSVREFLHRHPTPADILLLVEVSDSSRAYDLERKARSYPRAGVPEYWVLDLVRRELIVHLDPAADEYRTIEHRRPGDRVTPKHATSDASIDVSDLLP